MQAAQLVASAGQAEAEAAGWRGLCSEADGLLAQVAAQMEQSRGLLVRASERASLARVIHSPHPRKAAVTAGTAFFLWNRKERQRSSRQPPASQPND
eukprot:SAG22_NODE_288_length_12949_cov_163.316265_10_plen_97_part_00